MTDGVDDLQGQIDPAILRLVPGELARTYLVFPLRREEDFLVLAVHIPPDPDEEDHLRFVANCELQYVEVPLMNLKYAIWRHYGLAAKP